MQKIFLKRTIIQQTAVLPEKNSSVEFSKSYPDY